MDAKELQEVAKQREVRGYRKMPKAKLIAAVRKKDKQRKINDYNKPPNMAVASLCDSQVPDLQEPVLQLTKVKPKSFAERIKHTLSKYNSDFTRRVEVSLIKVKPEIDFLTDW